MASYDTWAYLGDKVNDITHIMYYRGELIKAAYYRGEKIWGMKAEPVYFINFRPKSYGSSNELLRIYFPPGTNVEVAVSYDYGDGKPEIWYSQNEADKAFPSDQIDVNGVSVGISTYDSAVFIARKSSSVFNSKPLYVSVRAIGTDFRYLHFRSSSNNATFSVINPIPKVISMDDYLFYNSAIREISANAFDNNTEHEDFSSLFTGCGNLLTVPDGLFDKCTNAKRFAYTFYGTGPNLVQSSGQFTIPSGLFKNCKKAEDFSHCFDSCNTRTIPYSLFSGLYNAKDFSFCFNSLMWLTSGIPENLFYDCINAENLERCFTGISEYAYKTVTVEIPRNLFRNCVNLKNVKQCFAGTYISYPNSQSHKIVSVPADLFSTCQKLTDVSACFQIQENITSEIPPLWERSPSYIPANHRGYAQGCTNAINYDSIPEGWK